jgi:hypothetical protein
MVYKERNGNELYVYMNGSLLYKKWFNAGGGGVIFNDAKSSPLGHAQRPYRANDVWQHVTDKDLEEKRS